MPAFNFILQLLEVLDRNDSTLETSFFQLKVQTFNDFFHLKPALILCEAALLPNGAAHRLGAAESAWSGWLGDHRLTLLSPVR